MVDEANMEIIIEEVVLQIQSVVHIMIYRKSDGNESSRV